MMEKLWQKLGNGIHLLTKHSGFIAVAALALALGIGASVVRAGVVSAALLKPVADGSGQQVAPGVGADTEDPKKVLRAADEALHAVRSVTYEAQYQGVGAFATRTATVIGKASLAKLPAGDPLVARLVAEGAFYQTGSDEAVAFHTAFDGRMIRKLGTQTKVMVEKDVDTDPKGRTLGGVTMLFGGGAYQVMMFEYVRDKPLAKQIDAPVTEYEGRTNIGGVLCHVVYVECDQRPDGRVKRERWFIGIKDNLLRKFEDVAVDDKGRYGAYVLTLSNVRVNPPLDDLAFTIKLPEGYKVKPYEPPNRPALLAVGDPAPDWKLADAAGQMHALADYRGKLVVLDFWATWCGPCVQAMPNLQKLHEKYHERGVEIIGINAWEESNAAAYMKEKGYTYGLLLKGEAVAEAYRANTLPTVYVIGADGKIIYRGVGVSAENLGTLIEQRLKGQERYILVPHEKFLLQLSSQTRRALCRKACHGNSRPRSAPALDLFDPARLAWPVRARAQIIGIAVANGLCIDLEDLSSAVGPHGCAPRLCDTDPKLRRLWGELQPTLPRPGFGWRFLSRRSVSASAFVGRLGCHGSVPALAASASAPG